jgi:hypothetical protein
MGRGRGLDAHSLRAPRGGHAGGPSVPRSVHRDGIVVVERVEELPVLIGNHRKVHDVGGWRLQKLEIRPSQDALMMVSE